MLAGGGTQPVSSQGTRDEEACTVRIVTSLLMSRVMHFVAVMCLAGLAAVADLGHLYLGGVALVAILLVYEQSLVSEHDLSQVKRAFDLNGYVGILYFLATAASLYVH